MLHVVLMKSFGTSVVYKLTPDGARKHGDDAAVCGTTVRIAPLVLLVLEQKMPSTQLT